MKIKKILIISAIIALVFLNLQNGNIFSPNKLHAEDWGKASVSCETVEGGGVSLKCTGSGSLACQCSFANGTTIKAWSTGDVSVIVN